MTTTLSPATTRTQLLCAAVAGPLWTTVSLVQAATRAGFDLTRHPLSQLSTGTLGWLQITNFIVAGVLMIVGASGLRRALPSRWAPRLLAAAGAGMLAAGVFVMDPGGGFPVGVATYPAQMSWHSVGHMVAGSVTFAALVACCWVLARHLDGGRAWASVAAGLALLLGWGWAMTGGALGTLTLAVGAITAMLWVAAVAAGLRRAAGAPLPRVAASARP